MSRHRARLGIIRVAASSQPRIGIVSIEARGRENKVRVCRFDSDALPADDADRSNR
ncbi:MAG: hypothetical protein GY802_12100 [Gammaproteobacteria bacterium]|nr:hypothetical protein [Gammaproteobacteria bacterium]